ncbi:MAG: hemolysin family protein [Myxococcota bacterium]|nr:hemolysin family protein [Myxococcota bacterium]MEC9389582.1 hemolysin family protein [Myxococcota bacterium]
MTTLAVLALIGGVLLPLSGFFSGSEIALVSADRMKLRADAERGRRGSILALQMLQNPTRMLSTCLVGTNLVAICIATLGTQLVLTNTNVHPSLAFLLVVPVTLTFGEMIPKAVYQHHADTLVPYIVIPLQFLSWILSPALWLFDRIARLAGGAGHDERPVTRADIQVLLDATDDPNLSDADKAMIRRVFEFTEAVVEDAMVPLIHVVAVPEDITVADAAARMIESGHSRLPVYRERVDDITGVVLHQDLMNEGDWTKPISQIARPPLFVPESKRVDHLLLDLRRARLRMAVAVDEYGGSVGIITVEDLLEEIVGDIEDELDREKARVRRVGEREWLALGHAEREHLVDQVGLDLPDGDYETIAGFILSQTGRIPKAGEQVEAQGHLLTVNKANERAIQEVHIRRIKR